MVKPLPPGAKLSLAFNLAASFSFGILPILSILSLLWVAFVMMFWDDPNTKIPKVSDDRMGYAAAILALAGVAWLVCIILYFADRSARRRFYSVIPGIFFLAYLAMAAWAWSAIYK